MKRKILIVDDSTSMRQMLAFTIKNADYETIEACDGQEALDVIKKDSTFDLIITDVNMPNMNGLEFTAEARKVPSYKFVPILILSTESGIDKKMAGKKSGATGWIVKPFNPVQILATIKRVL